MCDTRAKIYHNFNGFSLYGPKGMKKILALALFALLAAGCSDTTDLKWKDEPKITYSNGDVVGASVRDPVTGELVPAGKGKYIPVSDYNGLKKSPADTTKQKDLRKLIDAQRQELAARAATRDDLQQMVNNQTPKDVKLDTDKSERLFIGPRHGIPE